MKSNHNGINCVDFLLISCLIFADFHFFIAKGQRSGMIWQQEKGQGHFSTAPGSQPCDMSALDSGQTHFYCPC